MLYWTIWLFSNSAGPIENNTNKPPFHFGRTIKKDTSPSLYRYQREGDVLFVKLAGLSKATFCQQARKEDSIRD